MAAFNQIPLKPEILTNLEALGFDQMTPIQELAIPAILEGQDVIAQAKTGSGKTAAFGLAVLEKLNLKLFWPQVLILCPTRELAEQVCNELRRLARLIDNVKILALCGGVSEYHQQRSLHHGVHIIVGTPGRVQRLLNIKAIDLKHLETFILDEADKMLDMGFIDAINKIAERVPNERQTLLFSATFPREIAFLSRDLQKRNPKQIKIDNRHEENIIQQKSILLTDDGQKFAALPIILDHYNPASVLIFCNTKDTCRSTAKELRKLNIEALEIHGDLEQRDRTLIMAKFSNRSCSILVATDVAARGLDIDNLEMVINFDISPDKDVHIHRIGRTGRAGKEGIALNLFTPKERYYLNEVEEHLKVKLELIKLESLTSSQPYQNTSAPMRTIFIAGGKKDKIRPADILGALTGDAGIEGSAVGKIQIMDVISYVAIQREFVGIAVARLNEGKIKGKKFRVKKV